MKKQFLLLCFAIFSNNLIFSQVTQSDYLQGYEKEISGYTLNYHSPLPNVSSSLLMRATKDFQPIEWETEVIPKDFSAESISFIWMYGFDTDIENYNFNLWVNGNKTLSFTSPVSNENKEWSTNGLTGAKLTFHVTMIDKYKDQMGFAVLTLPKSDFIPGKAVNLKVTSEDANSSRWYMTFKAAIVEEIQITQENVVKKEESGLSHIVRFDITHLGEETSAIIKIGDISKQIALKPGHNSVSINIPKIDHPTKYTAEISIGENPATQRQFELNPVKEWTVYLVQHSHTDIGYTRPQTEILAEHLRYIDYALDFCDQTDNYPDDAKFRWTCESSWAVREYLKSRPQQQIDRLVKRINEGRIEVTAMFFNYSELADESSLVEQTKTLIDFKKQGIESQLAMQNDVNGIGWCLADYFQNTGVKYLIMGQHGHRARVPFDKPTAFWWESPSGKRLLAYRSEHYMYGNTLGLTSGDIDKFRKNVGSYLNELEQKDYPWLHTALQFSGYITDNAPPSNIGCDMIKDWNEQYEWPKLKIAVASDFMEYVKENHSDELDVKRVAWPDWWTDGAGSAFQEMKAVRTTHCDLITNKGLLSMAKLMGQNLPEDIYNDIDNVQDALLFYDEHTYGAAESISDPLIENSVIQWNEKAAYAWEAVKRSRMLKEKAMGFVQASICNTDVPSILIFNTLNSNRSGLVDIYIDHEILPSDKAFKIIDQDGNEMAAQALTSRSDGTYWGIWVEDIPPMGYKQFRIEVSEQNRRSNPAPTFNGTLENEFYKIDIDSENGVISSVFDKDLQQEIIEQNDTTQMGRFIYERLENRHQMERFTYNKIDTVFKPLLGKRTYLQNIRITGFSKGPVWQSLFLNGEIPECADHRGINIEVRLYNKEKRIELNYNMVKLAVTDPESIYISFPFNLPDSHLAFEAQGGMVYPGINQLEGTASDWNTIQNFAAVRNDSAQIIFGSNDAPLVQFGAINTGRYYYKHEPKTSHIYSWVLNNYWTTNFKASQEGEIKWSYYITSSNDNSNSFATKFGWNSRIPFATRVLPSWSEKTDLASGSYIQLEIQNIILVSASPSRDAKGIILHLRETEGMKTEIEVKSIESSENYIFSEVNVLEEEKNKIPDKINLEPNETKFIKVIPDQQ